MRKKGKDVSSDHMTKDGEIWCKSKENVIKHKQICT